MSTDTRSQGLEVLVKPTIHRIEARAHEFREQTELSSDFFEADINFGFHAVDPVFDPLETVFDSPDPTLDSLEPVFDSFEPGLDSFEPDLDSFKASCHAHIWLVGHRSIVLDAATMRMVGQREIGQIVEGPGAVAF